MFKKFRVVISVLLSVALLLSVFSANAYAVEVSELQSEVIERELYPGQSAVAYDLDSVDTPELRNFLKEQIISCTGVINLRDFNIERTSNNAQVLYNIIYESIPEAFHVKNYSYSSYSGQITYVTVNYLYSAEDYAVMLSELISNADKLLKGIENNDSLTEVEKALLLHDRLAVWNEYDSENLSNGTIPEESFNAYGALVKKVSVCQGYAFAYMYLLNRVGIENKYCTSNTLYHGWNIVYIDGVPYHVDVTWDDSSDFDGEARHDNFLLSTDKLRESHDAYDFNEAPQDTRYDSGYPWADSRTEFQLLNGIIYYIDNKEQTINSYVNGEVTELHDVSSIWRANPYSRWPSKYARLSSDGIDLLFSDSDGVYAYNPISGIETELYKPKQTSITDHVFGFTYSDGKLICNITNNPNYKKDQFINASKQYEKNDINDDGIIGVMDLSRIIRLISEGYKGFNLDLNGDGEVNSADLITLKINLLNS